MTGTKSGKRKSGTKSGQASLFPTAESSWVSISGVGRGARFVHVDWSGFLVWPCLVRVVFLVLSVLPWNLVGVDVLAL